MDAEELRDLLGDVYVTLARCAEAYGGTVEKFIGDAVMAVFGVPVAHEDDAERAVRAALLMRSRLAAVAERREVPLVLRIGVNTGLVVTGTTPGRDFLVTGEAVNLAARLQQAAEPGEVLVGERTFRAVEPLVRMVAPRSLAVRGRTGPVTAYAVERFAPAGAYRRRRRPYGPFVGREVELTLIRSVVERAVEHRRAHLLTLIGEAGIGKSRLVEEAVVELRRSEEPPAVWVGRCLPYGEGGPYAPLRDLLLRAAAVRTDASREEIRSRVTGQLQAILPEGSDEQIAELLRFVGGERMLPAGDDDEPGDRGRDAWRNLLLRMAARQATLLVIEDAHWAEPALLELIASVVAGDVRVPLVVVCVARAELYVSHPGWGSGMRNETTVTLEALDAGEMHRLANALAASVDPPPSVVELAGGNPFFLEEILAMSGESGGDDRVPETVQGVIAARLDLLDPDDKRLLQRAAVVGRSFTLEQLEPLLNGGGRGPTGRLRNLVDRDLIHHRGGGRHSFKHALIRDVAYESIPRVERARLHLRLAEQLESSPETACQVVAGHYAAAATLGEAAARAPAVRALLQAAQEARSVEAHGLALPAATRTPVTTPAPGAVTASSIFIASSRTSVWPSSTCSPSWTSTRRTVPGMGAAREPPGPSALAEGGSSSPPTANCHPSCSTKPPAARTSSWGGPSSYHGLPSSCWRARAARRTSSGSSGTWSGLHSRSTKSVPPRRPETPAAAAPSAGIPGWWRPPGRPSRRARPPSGRCTRRGPRHGR